MICLCGHGETDHKAISIFRERCLIPFCSCKEYNPRGKMSTFKPECELSKPYAKGSYNKFDNSEQWIRISEGCPNRCPFCRESYENPELKVLPIPEIVRNEVRIMDMNLLSHPEALEIIKDLGSRRVGGKVVYYECICGIDYRFLTLEIAQALKLARFKNLRIAWDFSLTLQKRIKTSLELLWKAGFKPSDVTIFMICNWRTPYEQNLLKLDLCKVWNVKAADCYYDNQLSPNIEPRFWTAEQIKDFRHRVRKHNQIVNFKIDPELEANQDLNSY